MSQHTSDPTVIVRERDRAFLCYQKHGNGRCRKKVASSVGEVVCDNGHSIPLYELMNAYLKDGMWVRDHIGGLWPSVDATRAIIERITRPEFLHSTSEEWQHQIVTHWPFMSWLINRAQHFDRKAAMMLKDFLEKEIRARFRILGTYLDAVKSKNSEEAVRVRERIFRSLANWNSWQPRPEDYLALWEIQLEAAVYLKDEVLVNLYQHNVSEAAACVQTEGDYNPLYFEHKDDDGDFSFSLLPDPFWQASNWIFNQITLRYRHDRGDVVWSVDHNAPEGLGKKVHERFDRAEKELREKNDNTGEYWGFSEHGPQKIRLHPPQEGSDAVASPHNLSHRHVLEAMKEIRSEFGGSHFGRHFLRQ